MSKTTKLRSFAALAALCLAAACGGKSAPPPAEPAPAEPVATYALPDAKLSEAQCGEAVDHAIDILAADPQTKQFAEQMMSDRGKFVADCQETGRQKDYDCLMAAKTFAELGSCEEPGENAAPVEDDSGAE